MKYIINTKDDGDYHDVHQTTCEFIPVWLYQCPIGDFISDNEAVSFANKIYDDVKKCPKCMI